MSESIAGRQKLPHRYGTPNNVVKLKNLLSIKIQYIGYRNKFEL